ncbi:MAG: heavy metal translocating P-type ATPase [Eubacteriales bacterium]|nr:heavy metal translocating P-type ATPase [Eubacteriales bacterium]
MKKITKNLTGKQKNLLYRIIAAAVMVAVLLIAPLKQWPLLRFALFLAPYLTVGYDVLRKAFKGIRKRQVFDECFLMAVATIGAMALGEYTEGVAVMLFYQVGELFQSIAVGRSRQSISELMDIRPDYANLEEDGEISRVDPDEVETGSIIVIRPGEKIPIDGTVIEGASSINTSALTGESVPRDVEAGSEVLSGSINLSGLLRVRTTREFDESTASKILELVENAGERKAKSEQFITKFARVYTPAVCYCALALAVLGPVISVLAMGRESFTAGGSISPALVGAAFMAVWGDWIYRALTFLVISCPCAIVVSIPLTFFGGIGGASRKGVLIKGSNFMETLANVRCVVMDKTGTITEGSFEVTGVHENRMPEAELLELAALAEGHSGHPIASSIRRAWQKAVWASDAGAAPVLSPQPGAVPGFSSQPGGVPGFSPHRVTDVEEISGKGIVAVVDGRKVAAGNLRLMEHEGISCKACESIGTIVYIAVDGRYEGHLVIADAIKPGAAEAVRDLRAAGVSRTVMLTGDVEAVAGAVAGEVGITEFRAGLLPGDKVSAVEELLAEKEESGGRNAALAFVGDGINDAPVLSRADVGIAMGALGSDAAIEAADVVLMDDDPRKIALSIRLARKCILIVYENITFALGVKLVCLLLGALGIANMWIAIFADVGVMVLCVLNAIRAMF